MNKSTLYVLLAAVLGIAVVLLLVRLVSGAVSVVTSGFNAVLGIVVVVALLAIVAWMLLYAKRH